MIFELHGHGGANLPAGRQGFHEEYFVLLRVFVVQILNVPLYKPFQLILTKFGKVVGMVAETRANA